MMKREALLTSATRYSTFDIFIFAVFVFLVAVKTCGSGFNDIVTPGLAPSSTSRGKIPPPFPAARIIPSDAPNLIFRGMF